MCAATPLEGYASFSIEEVPIVALAALEACPAARGRHREAGAGEVTGTGAELVVAVGWAGEGWGAEKKGGITIIAPQKSWPGPSGASPSLTNGLGHLWWLQEVLNQSNSASNSQVKASSFAYCSLQGWGDARFELI